MPPTCQRGAQNGGHHLVVADLVVCECVRLVQQARDFEAAASTSFRRFGFTINLSLLAPIQI